MLKITDLTVNYGGITALHNVSFEVKTGEIVSLIGANGAGKSTILKAIAGLNKWVEGDVLFCGESMDKWTTQKIVESGISLVPEGRRVFKELTVLENLEMGAYTRKGREEIKVDLAAVYQRFPILLERKKQVASTLSGGEQQMLAMGRALMSKPKLLLLDEPSMGLAPIFIKEIFRLIQEIQAQGTTILLIEQNAKMALSIATRGYVLETGRIVLEGTGQELLHSDAVRKAYLGG
ncbi:MAG: ABC transporter ATP-binding protein [Culicoidibacterales bacterium]